MKKSDRESIENTIKDLETSSVLTLDPKEQAGYEKQINHYKLKLANKRDILQRAYRIARETLRECEDFQTACVYVLQDTKCYILFDGLTEEDLTDKLQSIVRFAEHQVGFSR